MPRSLRIPHKGQAARRCPQGNLTNPGIMRMVFNSLFEESTEERRRNYRSFKEHYDRVPDSAIPYVFDEMQAGLRGKSLSLSGVPYGTIAEKRIYMAKARTQLEEEP